MIDATCLRCGHNLKLEDVRCAPCPRCGSYQLHTATKALTWYARESSGRSARIAWRDPESRRRYSVRGERGCDPSGPFSGGSIWRDLAAAPASRKITRAQLAEALEQLTRPSPVALARANWIASKLKQLTDGELDWENDDRGGPQPNSGIDPIGDEPRS